MWEADAPHTLSLNMVVRVFCTVLAVDHMQIAEGQPFSDCPSVDLKLQNFTPKSPVCHWLISEKNWSWAGVSVGIGRPLRKQNRIRQSPTPVPSCHRQYTVSNASQYNIQLNLEFCPHCPSLPTCGFIPIPSRRSERGTPTYGNEKVSPQSMLEP